MYYFEIKVLLDDEKYNEPITIKAESYDIGKSICDSLYFAENVNDVSMNLIEYPNGFDNPIVTSVYEMSDPNNDIISKKLNYL